MFAIGLKLHTIFEASFVKSDQRHSKYLEMNIFTKKMNSTTILSYLDMGIQKGVRSSPQYSRLSMQMCVGASSF